MNWLFKEEMEMAKNWNGRRTWWEVGMSSSSSLEEEDIQNE